MYFIVFVLMNSITTFGKQRKNGGGGVLDVF